MIQALIFEIPKYVGIFNSWIASALNGNTLIAGAATASILGSIAYFARGLPKRLWHSLRHCIVFTYYIEYGLTDNGTLISHIAEKFEYDIQKRISGKRSVARITTRNKRLSESLANGGFLFRYEGALIWVHRSQQGTNKSREDVNNQITTLSLTSLRFHRKKIMHILNKSAKDYATNGIYQLVCAIHMGEKVRAIRCRNFNSLPVLAIDHEVKTKIDTAIDNFLKYRSEKKLNDFPHKLVFMLHGEPGTGKSALGEYIAFRLKTSLFVFNGITDGPHYSNTVLGDAVRAARDSISENEIPVVLLDDFDTYIRGITKRKSVDESDDDKRDSVGSVNLGRMLASLQSPVEITDSVVIFTTNHLDKIDPALYRPGRVNVMINVGRMSPKSIVEYYETSYGDKWPEHTPIEKAWRACDVSAFFEANKDNPRGFIKEILSTEASTDEAFQSKECNVVV